jgi:hypothetical protein
MVSIFRDDLDNFGHQFHPFPFPKNLSRGTPDFCSQPQLFLLGWLARFRDFLNRLMCTIAVRKPSIPQLTIPNGGDGHRWAIKIVVLGTQIIPFSGVAVWNPFKQFQTSNIWWYLCNSISIWFGLWDLGDGGNPYSWQTGLRQNSLRFLGACGPKIEH